MDLPSADPSPAGGRSLANLPLPSEGLARNAMNSAPPPATENIPVNISGRWKDADENTAVVFRQDGNRVHMVATQQGVAVEGTGILTERQLSMILTMAGVSFAELNLTLSPNGRTMQGIMRAQGETEQVTFTR
ncbi:MAG: hypothetical protein H0U63_01965 [Burkholderiales bacterium]|nr:hypothetical protein [Burkholderiales bacterium]